MNRPLLLAHGWGYDAHVWDALLAFLPDHEPYCIEAGYFGAEPAWPSLPDGILAIGHSAGVPTLLENLPSGCAGLVVINGFTRFVAAIDFPGVPDRLPSRMLTRLRTAPGETLGQFRASCDDHTPSGPLDTDRLVTGLQHLKSCDSRDRLAGLSLPILVLAATDDPIVLPAHTRACFAPDSVRWSDTGGHLLPLTRPDWCARQIAAFPC